MPDAVISSPFREDMRLIRMPTAHQAFLFELFFTIRQLCLRFLRFILGIANNFEKKTFTVIQLPTGLLF